jgi:hypothetical protein
MRTLVFLLLSIASVFVTESTFSNEVEVQTGGNTYSGAYTTSLGVTFSKPENAGGTVEADVPHGSSAVTDNNGDTFVNTGTQTADGHDIWKATNIHGAGWNVTTTAYFPSTYAPSMTVTESNEVQVQTGGNIYSGAYTTSLGVTFSKPENAGGTVEADVPHGSSTVTDNNGDTFVNTGTQTADGHDIWKATNIHGAGWNVTTTAYFPSTYAPSMTVTETKP